MQNRRLTLDRILAIPAGILIVTAWFIGSHLHEQSSIDQIKEQLPDVESIEMLSPGIFSLNQATNLYFITGKGNGYGGQVTTLFPFDSSGNVAEPDILNHHETPSFIKRLENRGFLKSFTGISWEDAITQQNLPDAISGATYSCEAISLGLIEAASQFADFTNQSIPQTKLPRADIKWDHSHTILLIVFVLAFITTQSWFRPKKSARWIMIVFNVIFLGFWMGNQLSIVQMTRFGYGEVPTIQQHLFFYIMLTGSLLFIFFFRKNIYYDRICPFGGAQECLAAIGGAKRSLVDKKNRTRWLPRILALAIILIAILFRHPSSINYEVFSAFFQLIGNTLQFSLLIIILVTALFFRRPWCSLMCPVKPVFDFVKMLQSWLFQFHGRN